MSWCEDDQDRCQTWRELIPFYARTLFDSDLIGGTTYEYGQCLESVGCTQLSLNNDYWTPNPDPDGPRLQELNGIPEIDCSALVYYAIHASGLGVHCKTHLRQCPISGHF
jgi:hypothetical protein